MQRALRAIARGVVHNSLSNAQLEQQQATQKLVACVTQLSDLLVGAAGGCGVWGGGNSASSVGGSSSGLEQWQSCAGSVRGMAGRTHKLSLKKANNRASWMAVAPYLENQQQQQQAGDALSQQQQQAPVIQTAIPPLPVLEEPVLYQRIGRITGPYSVGTQPCFAVMESGGSQWKVTADDIIYHNKIPGVQVNDVLEFNKVLLLGTRDDTTIGRPFVPGASVVAAVEETFKDAKVLVFKKKARKRYSKLQGHRSQITALRILEVRQPAAAAATTAAAVSNVEALGSQRAEALDTANVALTAQQLRQQRRKLVLAMPQQPPTGGLSDEGSGFEGAAASSAAAAGGQARSHRRPSVREGRPHGPPAVLNAVGPPPHAAKPQ